MCSRIFLFFILVVLCNINSSLTRTHQYDDRLLPLQLKDYDIKILQQNVKLAELEKIIEHQNVRFAEQDREMAEQNTLIANHKTLISEQNTLIANHKTLILEQNTLIANHKTLIAEQNTLIANHKTLIAEQNTLIANHKTEQNVELCELRSQIELLKKSQTEILQKSKTNSTSTSSPIFSNDTGVMFTRWGRSDCPRSISTQVYNGTTGGGLYTHQGASVNYVCMSNEPLYNENKHYSGPYWGYLYGAEHEEGPRSGLFQYEVPCAVCRAAPYTTKLMIPGRNKCFPGWQEVYRGELRSGYHGHKAASEYVCLDEHAQRTGKINNDNGKLFYPVRAVCGSLPCPPYEQHTLLTCVVCVK